MQPSNKDKSLQEDKQTKTLSNKKSIPPKSEIRKKAEESWNKNSFADEEDDENSLDW